MHKFRLLALLLLASLAACKTPLYGEGGSSADIKSALSPEMPAPDIYKMYLLIDPGPAGIIPFGTFYLTSKEFGDIVAQKAERCRVQVTTNFDERWNIIRPSLPVLTEQGRAAIAKIDHDKIAALAPNAVLTVKSASETMTKQWGRTTLSNFEYTASLQDYPAGKSFWKASINLRPGQSEEAGSPGAVLAHAIIRKMAEDGVLKGCPSLPAFTQ